MSSEQEREQVMEELDTLDRAILKAINSGNRREYRILDLLRERAEDRLFVIDGTK